MGKRLAHSKPTTLRVFPCNRLTTPNRGIQVRAGDQLN
jgi:hypothetical protein